MQMSPFLDRLRREALRGPTWRDMPVVLLLLLLAAGLSWTHIRDKSNTVDEVAHILAGLAYWELKDYRLAPESGMLPNRVAALPLLFAGELPPLPADTAMWARSDHWALAREWWFASGTDPARVLRLSRAAMLAFNLIGLGLVFFLAARYWGRAGGYGGLLLAASSPNFLGHMPLATSDFALSWVLALAVVCYARLLERVSPGRLLGAGLSAGLALLCKQSAVLLAPVALVLLTWKVFQLARSGPGEKTPWRAGLHLLMASGGAALLATLVLWTGYGWRYNAAHPAVHPFEDFRTPWAEIQAEPSALNRTVERLRTARLLPEAYLYGLSFVAYKADRGGFLNGKFSKEGFRLYFLWNFLYKTYPPAILLHLAGWVALAAVMIRRSQQMPAGLKGLIVMAGLFTWILTHSSLNIGYRHAFPLLFISCLVAGGLFSGSVQQRRWKTSLGLLLLLLSLLPLAWLNRDRYISYVNAVGGGEKRAFKALSDSSLDWGQDLPAARRFIEHWRQQNPKGSVYLASYGTALPEGFGLEDTRFLPIWGFRQRQAFLPHLGEGLYVLSSNAFSQTNPEWDPIKEREYIVSRNVTAQIYTRLADAADGETDQADFALSQAERAQLELFEAIRFHRLLYYLREREPDELIHGSMLIFDISEAELADLNW